MYTLYWSPGAASLCVHWMLIELGEPHELKKLDLEAGDHRKPEHLHMNPNGLVPTSSSRASRCSSSAALLMLLAERHPAAGLAPPVGSDNRGLTRPGCSTVEHHPSRHPQLVRSEAPGGAATTESVKATARGRIESGRNRVEAQIAAGGALPGRRPRGRRRLPS